MKNRLIILSALLMMIFTVLSFASEKAEIDKPAPDFTLTDVYGKTHKLSDYKGKYVILEWVNFDCPFVKKHYETNNMQAVQKMQTDEGAVWLSICSSAPGKQGHFDNDKIIEKIESLKAVPTAYLIDEVGDVGRLYSAKTTPDMRIISPEGILIYSGAIDNIASTDKSDIGKATNYIVSTMTNIEMGREIDPKTTKPYGCSVKYDR